MLRVYPVEYMLHVLTSTDEEGHIISPYIHVGDMSTMFKLLASCGVQVTAGLPPPPPHSNKFAIGSQPPTIENIQKLLDEKIPSL